MIKLEFPKKCLRSLYSSLVLWYKWSTFHQYTDTRSGISKDKCSMLIWTQPEMAFFDDTDDVLGLQMMCWSHSGTQLFTRQNHKKRSRRWILIMSAQLDQKLSPTLIKKSSPFRSNNTSHQSISVASYILTLYYPHTSVTLTRSIRDSETSIDFVQGPPGSRRERVKDQTDRSFVVHVQKQTLVYVLRNKRTFSHHLIITEGIVVFLPLLFIAYFITLLL